MDKGPGQTFLKKKYANDQQVHEKEPNITDHQDNENQNQKETSPYTGQNGCYQKDKRQIIIVGEDVKKGEHFCTVGGNVNWNSHYRKNSVEFPQNNKNGITL